MKNTLLKTLIAVLITALSISFTGCKTTVTHTTTTKSSKPLPPGQAKKIHGDKSAKKYAPGQQKKKHKKKH